MKKNIQLLGTTFITVLILLVSMLPLTACSSSQQYTYKSMDMNAILQKVGTKTVKNKSVVFRPKGSKNGKIPAASLSGKRSGGRAARRRAHNRTARRHFPQRLAGKPPCARACRRKAAANRFCRSPIPRVPRPFPAPYAHSPAQKSIRKYHGHISRCIFQQNAHCRAAYTGKTRRFDHGQAYFGTEELPGCGACR